MSKKKFGKFVVLATVSGVIAAGISYFLKYKSFHDELDEDFHDFEGDDEFDGSLPHASETPNRTYVTLNEKADEAADLAKDSVDYAGEAAKKVTGHSSDTAREVADAAREAADAAREAAGHAVDVAKEAAHFSADAAHTMAEHAADTAREAAHFSADAAQAMTRHAADTARDVGHFSAGAAQNMAAHAADAAMNAAHFSADIAREVKEHAAGAARDVEHYISTDSTADTVSHTADTGRHFDGAGNTASDRAPANYEKDARYVVNAAVDLRNSLSGSAKEWLHEEKGAEKVTASAGRDASDSTTIIDDDLQ